MALTPRIELRQQQSLVMTPQMQQAIKLLQMSNLELAEYVAEEVEKNPLTELAPAPAAPASGSSAGSGGADDDAIARLAAETSLWDHLHAQIRAMRLAADVAEAALLIADELEDDGYLREPLAEVATRHRLGARAAAAGLAAVQGCEPVGVGARGLAECLALQLRERDRLDPAMRALLGHLELAARGRETELCRLCGVDAEDLADMLAEIRALDPRPGARFADAPVQLAVPDVFVRRGASGTLVVELNTQTLPRVLVSNIYAARTGDGAAQAFISECRSSATWLVRALEQRARTILKVASDIVTHQERFFSLGAAELRPLTQKVVADRVGLHESTISRVAAGKFLACDRGSFEMRYFFSSAIQAVAGGEGFSAVAVQDRIRAMVGAEAVGRPLSDDRIVTALKADGIDIARRTVAKYRDVMGIPSSVERRRRERSRPAP